MSSTWEEEQPRTVAFHTLGCKANQLESSAIADEFRGHGWEVLPFSEPASLYIINTCTVTEDGDRESRRIIRKARRTNPNGRVAVTGCYVQVAPGQVAGIEGVSYVIGNNFKQDIYRITQETPPEKAPIVRVSEIDKSRILAGGTQGGINRTRASLKIQDGCDFKCTYCIIWVARGPSRSLPVAMLKAQLQDLVRQGHHEVVLTGINIGQYEDPTTGEDLAALLQAFVTIPGNFRLRLSSLDPAEVTPQLLDVMAENPEKICPYLHLSIQSAEDHVLKRMARRHRVADLYRVCDAIMEKIPQASIGADIIVGFPEETKERFASTYQVLSDLPLSYFHTFTYSKRQGTPAADFEDQVPEPEKKKRTHQLIALSAEKNLHYRQRFLGKTLHVIVEEKQDRGMSENFIHVRLDRTDLPQNTLVPVTLSAVSPDESLGVVNG